MSHALLLIDLQNDYFPGGRMELEGSDAAVAHAARLADAFRQRQMPVLHVQHLSVRPGATFFLPGSEGALIHPKVAPLPGEKVFEKNYPNSFRGTGLEDHLQQTGIMRLTVAGMMTHLCVDTTVRAAFDLGFSCNVAHDACASRKLSFSGVTVAAEQVQASFIAALNGLFANAIASDELLKTL